MPDAAPKEEKEESMPDAAPKKEKEESMPDVPAEAASPAPATAGATEEAPENEDSTKRKRHEGETPDERAERKRRKKEKREKKEKPKSNGGSE